eukprot:gnl/Dysnectes_brevis/4735_a6507_756.p1 GENE.gnl/Dysnectes_brevis/4735_a6507_756~~gnl/Dysnectes_brevis/4735_a6507_756.p1  ORF type:complete len:102 (+),score=4.29 gnl/Dysnectes_brevis/4735_a6507_756:109-414(+)
MVCGLHNDLSIELAANDSCNHQEFFIGVCKLFIGDICRIHKDRTIPNAEKASAIQFINDMKRTQHPRLKHIADAGLYLIHHPETYTYAKWGEVWRLWDSEK